MSSTRNATAAFGSLSGCDANKKRKHANPEDDLVSVASPFDEMVVSEVPRQKMVCKSPVFGVMLEDGWLESTTGKILIAASSQSVRALCSFLQSGHASRKNLDVREMLELADYYQIDSMLKWIGVHCISEENVHIAMNFAYTRALCPDDLGVWANITTECYAFILMKKIKPDHFTEDMLSGMCLRAAKEIKGALMFYNKASASDMLAWILRWARANDDMAGGSSMLCSDIVQGVSVEELQRSSLVPESITVLVKYDGEEKLVDGVKPMEPASQLYARVAEVTRKHCFELLLSHYGSYHCLSDALTPAEQFMFRSGCELHLKENPLSYLSDLD